MKNTSTKTRLITVGAVGTAMLGGGLATASSASAASGSTWDRVASCESGGNWSISTGNGFSGGLQFTPSTWAAYGGQGPASGASRSAQIAVAERVLASQGPGAWPVCSKKAGLGRGGSSYVAAPQRAQQNQTSRSTTRSAAKQTTRSTARQQSSENTRNTQQQSVQKQSSTPEQSTKRFSSKKHTTTYRNVAPKVSTKATGRTITVHVGDTLSTLAQRYDVKGGWQGLFAMNKATVNNPNLIFVGQHLSI